MVLHGKLVLTVHVSTELKPNFTVKNRVPVGPVSSLYTPRRYQFTKVALAS
jgi:hypothetical protein